MLNGTDIVSHIWLFSLFYMIWHWITRESQIKVIEVYFCTEIFCGNEENWGQILRKKHRHEHEFISVWKFCGNEGNCMREILRGKTEAWKWDYFCMEFCGNEGNWGKIMYSNIFIYVSLIGNGTWKNVCQQQIQAIIEISWGGGGHNFAWPRIFN